MNIGVHGLYMGQISLHSFEAQSLYTFLNQWFLSCFKGIRHPKESILRNPPSRQITGGLYLFSLLGLHIRFPPKKWLCCSKKYFRETHGLV